MHIIPSFLVDKASCTRQFESELSLHSLASLFPIKEGFFRIPPSLLQGELHILTKPSLLRKEGSTSHLGLLPSGKKKETALLGARNRYAIRLADHQRSSPWLCGMGPPRDNYSICISLMLIYTSLRKTKTSNIYCYLLINFAANSKKSATFLKFSNC